MNESPHTCPDCGAPLPAGSPQALCPACLMRQALASRTIDGDGPAAAPPPAPEEIAGKFPQFEILECLGRGGMGVVYKARQKSLNRLVAIKILAPEREHDFRFAEHFAREAELLARLSHPHIVTIHDFGEAGGLFYLVMEFVDGVNLRDLLRDGKLEPEQALAIVPPVCEALQYAHDKGIVHRDIKPENLLLDRDGRIKIADFGIAALMGADSEMAGTPPYMAPEQQGGSVDRRTDIYALGVVLYEMLTGERPTEDVVAPSKKVQIDVRLDEVVLRALEKEPELRYQEASRFKTQVETIASGIAGALPAEPGVKPGSASGSRFSWLAVVGACWAAAGALNFYVPTLGYRMKSELVPNMMGIIGLSAPVAVTLLGWISIWQIRRSLVEIRGLSLAVLEVLLFPLLALDALIIGGLIWAARFLPAGTSTETDVYREPPWNACWWWMISGILICAIFDWMVVHKVIRWSQRPSGGGEPASSLVIPVLWKVGTVTGAILIHVSFLLMEANVRSYLLDNLGYNSVRTGILGSRPRPGSAKQLEREGAASENIAGKASTFPLTVMGAVARPGIHSLTRGATLVDALAVAGGWTSDADIHSITVKRGSKGEVTCDAEAILNGRDANPGLFPGYTVTVPNQQP